jgi:hypothetical protein
MSSDVQHSVTAADIEAKKQAWLAGHELGKRLLSDPDNLDLIPPRMDGPVGSDLDYLYYLGIGQAFANHGRDVAGLSSHRPTNDTEGKERK